MFRAKYGFGAAVVLAMSVAFGSAGAEDVRDLLVRTPPTPAAATPADAATIVARIVAATLHVRAGRDGVALQEATNSLQAQCLSDKFNQLAALGRAAAVRAKAFEAAAAKGEGDKASHHLRLLQTLLRRAQQLDAESSSCAVGEPFVFRDVVRPEGVLPTFDDAPVGNPDGDTARVIVEPSATPVTGWPGPASPYF